MLIDVCAVVTKQRNKYVNTPNFHLLGLFFPARCCYHKNVRWISCTILWQHRRCTAVMPGFLGYEEPEDECEGDPEEDLLQELLLLVLRRARTCVVACAARHGPATVGAGVHVGR